MEEWVNIEEVDCRYQISSKSRIRNTRTGRILKQSNYRNYVYLFDKVNPVTLNVNVLHRKYFKGNYIPVEFDNIHKSIKFIINTVAEFYKVSPHYILVKSNESDIVFCRQLVQHLASENTKLSLSQIGLEVGTVKEHAVYNSIRSIKNYLDTDKIKIAEIGKIQSLISKEFDKNLSQRIEDVVKFK